MNVLSDLQTEVELLFDDLNWTFILIYVFVLYGIRHKEEFKWFNDIMKNEYLKSFKVWIAGIMVILFFCLFKYLETGIDAAYVSRILRSWILVIVFNSIFDKRISKLENNNE